MYATRDGVSQSMLLNFMKCRKLCKFHIDGWESLEASTARLDYGTFYHYLLENWYKMQEPPDPQIFFDVLSRKWIDSMLKARADAQLLEDLVAKAACTWPGYVKRWASADAKYKWKFLEQTFDYQYHTDYRLRGKIDGVLEIDGKPWLFETKTKERIEENAISQSLTFDFQNLFYILACREQFGFTPVGCIYNIIRAPSLKKAKDDKSVNDRIVEDTRLRPEFYYIRYEVSYDLTVMKEFEVELQQKLLEFRNWALVRDLPGYSYKSECSCMARGYCTFLQACSSGTMLGYAQTGKLFRELDDESSKKDGTESVGRDQPGTGSNTSPEIVLASSDDGIVLA